MNRIIIICVSLIVILSFVETSYAAIDPKAIAAMWLFDEGSGTIAKDSSGNGKDGTLKGGAKWVVGQFGKALEFNGSDAWVEIPSIGSFDEVTIMLWINTTGRAGQWRVFIDNNVWKAADIHHQLYTDGRVEFSINGNPQGNDTFGKFIFDASQLNKWHHTATVYSKKEVKIRFYIDGKLDAENAWGGNPGVIGPARIGSWDGGGREFQGLMDEVIIYSGALSADDINTVINKGIKALAAVSNQGKLTTTWAAAKTSF